MGGGVIWVGRDWARRRAAEDRGVKVGYCKNEKIGRAVLRTRKEMQSKHKIGV